MRVLPDAALGPVVGPVQVTLFFSACWTALFTRLMVVGQPGVDGPVVGDREVREPRSQPTRTALATAMPAIAARTGFRMRDTVIPCGRAEFSGCEVEVRWRSGASGAVGVCGCSACGACGVVGGREG